MKEQDWLASQFEENRKRLQKVAHRMLGSESEADDAVQETWLRLSRSDSDAIDNLAGWLTTVVARICLDMLRSRNARRESSVDLDDAGEIDDAASADPEREAILADSMGPALLVVLDMLSPPERVAFVLHDMFGMPFEEIAPVVGRSTEAARQLASRARRRVRGTGGTGPDTSAGHSAAIHRPARHGRSAGESRAAARSPHGGNVESRTSQRRIVDAFLAASRDGKFDELLALLDPECAMRPDAFAGLLGGPGTIEGGRNVAEFMNGRAGAAVRATIGGVPGAAWAPNGKVRVAFSFTFRGDRIVDIELIADRKRLDALGVELIDE